MLSIKQKTPLSTIIISLNVTQIKGIRCWRVCDDRYDAIVYLKDTIYNRQECRRVGSAHTFLMPDDMMLFYVTCMSEPLSDAGTIIFDPFYISYKVKGFIKEMYKVLGFNKGTMKCIKCTCEDRYSESEYLSLSVKDVSYLDLFVGKMAFIPNTRGMSEIAEKEDWIDFKKDVLKKINEYEVLFD